MTIYIIQARECHRCLNWYPHGWPVEEFLKIYLKNKRIYACKWGYLTENTNVNHPHRNDLEEEQAEQE